MFADERLVYQSGRAQNLFVELYTSDANPDCNAALKWMSVLKSKDPKTVLWKQIVPVAFHVNYWDVPGYKDTFARPAFNDFLLRYRKKWNSRYAFAPSVVVNGTEWGGWSRGQEIPSALPREVGILKADGSKREGHFLGQFYPAKAVNAQNLMLHGVLLGFDLKSKPSEGDNRGQALTHDFIAIHYQEKPLKSSYGVLTTDIELAPTKGIRTWNYAVVFWITQAGDIIPIQATGGYLPSL